MATAQQDAFAVKRETEWEAITSAVRLEMLLFVQTIGPCSIRQLAELMDRPADGLYHHMRKLVRAGLIVEVERRKVGKQTEVVYDASAKDVTIDCNLRSKRTTERIARLFRTILLHAQRTVEAALRSGEASVEGDLQNVRLKWGAAWLDDEQLAELQQHQLAINDILQEGAKERKGRLYAVLTYLAPVVRNRGSRNPSSSSPSQQGPS
jgi:predicted transcriptional regulator